MNSATLAKHYDALTPAERFALILSADARGDEAEADRIAAAAGRVTYSVRDFVPYSQAFLDLAEGVYLQLFDYALYFAELESLSDDLDRSTESMFAAGFMLKTLLDGWKLFCERRHVPPFAVWQILPGWDHLKRLVKRAERLAFTRDEMLQYTNEISRRKGKPELTDSDVISPEGLADSLETQFGTYVKRHGG
jgi:hypothetical protein